MPKDSIEIKKFDKGVITNFDANDIPLDAASHSWNVDPISENGSLSGIEVDLDATGDTDMPLYDESAIINKDGKNTLIGYQPKLYNNTEASSSVFSYIKDFDGGINIQAINLDNSPGNNPIHACTMQVNNSEVHIGIGNAPAKWAGYIEYKQFGKDHGIAMENARLSRPSTFTDMHKIVNVGDYIYGIKWMGNYIYKFHKTTQAIEKSKKRYGSLQALCVFSGDSNHLWVYDTAEGSSGTLYKVHTDMTKDPILECALNPVASAGWKLSEVTDIIHTDGIWYIRPVKKLPKDKLNQDINAWIWKTGAPTESLSLSVSSKTPLFKNNSEQTTTAGEWHGLEEGLFYEHGTTFTSTDHDNQTSHGAFSFNRRTSSDSSGMWSTGHTNVTLPSVLDRRFLIKEQGENNISNIDRNSEFTTGTNDWAAFKHGTADTPSISEDDGLKITMGTGSNHGYVGAKLAAAQIGNDFGNSTNNTPTRGFRNAYLVRLDIRLGASSFGAANSPYVNIGKTHVQLKNTSINSENLSDTYDWLYDESSYATDDLMTTEWQTYEAYICPTATSGHDIGNFLGIVFYRAASDGGDIHINNVQVYTCRTAVSIGQSQGTTYNASSSVENSKDCNGMPTNDIHYDPEFDTYYEVLWDNRRCTDNGYIANNWNGADSQCAVWGVNTDPASINYGKLNLKAISPIANGYSTLNESNGDSDTDFLYPEKPWFFDSCIDTVNKVIFTTGNEYIFAQGYTSDSVNMRGTTIHDGGTSYVRTGAASYYGIACDPYSRKLFVLEDMSAPKIFSYSTEGKIHDQTGDWGSASNMTGQRYNGIAVDTDRNLVFVTDNAHNSGGTSRGRISSMSYSDSDEEFQPSMGAVTYGLPLVNSGYDAAVAISGGKIDIDTENRLVFVNIPYDTVGDIFLNIFSYDEDGHLTFVSSCESSVAHFLTETISNTNTAGQFEKYVYKNGLHATNHYSIIGDNQPLKIKVDVDSNLVFVHTGHSIISVPYNIDGTLDHDNFANFSNPERRIISVPRLSKHDANSQAYMRGYMSSDVGTMTDRGLGYGFAIVKSPNTFDQNTGQGMLLLGSHKGITTTKGYSNNTEYVNIPRTPLMKPRNNAGILETGIVFPMVTNNGLGDGTGSGGPKSGNHIYFADGSSKIKSQLYWIYVSNNLDPSQTNGTETLNGTVGDVFRGLANVNTGFTDKIHSVAQSQETNNKKIAFTSSDRSVIGQDEVASEFSISVKNSNAAIDWINIETNSDTAQAMTKTSETMSLKNPSITIFESLDSSLTDNDDLALDIFEGVTAGTGKWARLNYDESISSFVQNGTSTATKAYGSIKLYDPTSTIGDVITALTNTNGFTLVDPAGNSKMYIFQTSGGASGTDSSGKTIIQINGLSSLAQIAAQIKVAIDSSNGHGSGSSWNSITVSDGYNISHYPDIILLSTNATGSAGNNAITRGALPSTHITFGGMTGGRDASITGSFATGLLTTPVDGAFNLITKEQDSIRGGSGVKQGNKYFYKMSYMYDGYQEGPLSDDFTYVPSEDGNLEITVKLSNASVIPKRVSHINIYRSESSNVDASKPEGYYRLLKNIRLNTEWEEVESFEQSNPSYGNFKKFTCLDEGRLFESFESRAGYSSVIQDMNLRYELSTQLNNVHFVSNIHLPALDGEGENFLVKSFPYKFDTFDYTKDILRLPSRLTALEAYSGRIWAFSDSRMYKIEPNGLYIEDQSVGMGCVHKKSIVVTPNGMFWCDKKNIYWHNGQNILPIGDSIKKNGQYSWQEYAKLDDLGETGTCSNAAFKDEASCISAGATWTGNNEVDVDTATAPQPPIAVYDANKQSVHFIFQYFNAANTSHAKHKARFSWVFNIPLNKWDLMEIRDNNVGQSPSPLGKVLSAFTAPDGDAWYIINSNDSAHTTPAWKINKGASKRAYTWESKDITLGKDSQYKHFYGIDISGVTGDLSSYLTLEVDGTSVAKSFEATETGGRYVISYGFRKGKKLKIKLNEVPGTNVIDSIGIIFRFKGNK